MAGKEFAVIFGVYFDGDMYESNHMPNCTYDTCIEWTHRKCWFQDDINNPLMHVTQPVASRGWPSCFRNPALHQQFGTWEMRNFYKYIYIVCIISIYIYIHMCVFIGGCKKRLA